MQDNIQQYLKAGQVDFEKVLSIPATCKIPNLTHVYGFDQVRNIMVVLITQFNNSLNLIRPMSADQIVECAYEMVMTTEEDFLSVEDYVIFFKGAKAGKYGKILDRLDQQTIFSMLEEYRTERHRQYLKIKETRHLEYKGLGPSERLETDPIADSFYNIAGRLSDMKEKLKTQREINRASRL